MNTTELRQKRAEHVAELRALTETPKGPHGDLSPEQADEFDRRKAELEQVEKALERAESLAEFERRMQGTPVGTGGADSYESRKSDYSLTRALAGAAGMDVDDGLEREIGQEAAKRSGVKTQGGMFVPLDIEQRSTLTSANSGNMIATEHMAGQFIDLLRSRMVVSRLGARTLSNLTGDVEIPALDSSAVAHWFAENTDIPSSGQGFRQVAMAPKHVGARTEVSRNMLLQSSPDIEQLIRSDFADVIARAVDKAALMGTGTDNEPTGILNRAGVSEVADFAATWDKVQELIGAVEDEDATGTAFLTHPQVRRILRSTNKVSGEAEHGFVMDSRNTLDGYTVAPTTLTPITSGTPDTAPLIFGDFSDLLIGFWSELDVLVNPFESTAYSKGNVKIRAMMTADVALRHPESFAYGQLDLA